MESEISVLSLQQSVSLSKINPAQNSPHPIFLDESFSNFPTIA